MSLYNTQSASFFAQRTSGSGAGTTTGGIGNPTDTLGDPEIVVVHYVISGYLGGGATLQIGDILIGAPSASGGPVNLDVKDKLGLTHVSTSGSPAGLNFDLTHSGAADSVVVGHLIYYFD